MSKQVLIVGVNSFLSNAINKLHLNDEVDGVYYTKANPSFRMNYSIDQLEEIHTEYDVVYIVSALISNDLQQLNNILQLNVKDINRIKDKFSTSRIILCSSVSVFDALQAGNVDDVTIPTPMTIYGISKLMSEQIIRQHKNYGIIRISSMYGVGMKASTFLPKIIQHALDANKINLLGTGARLQNYVHVQDVAGLAKKLGIISNNETIFAIHPKNYSNSEVASIVQQLTGCSIIYTGEDSTRSITYTTENNLVKQHQFVDFIQGIEELIKWNRK